MKVNRRAVLNAGWTSAGAGLGAIGYHRLSQDPSTPYGIQSFSQCGEDLIVQYIFAHLELNFEQYLDIGANHPYKYNNTYYFYRSGYRGVLVEPNVSLCSHLRAARPGDTTVAAGVGTAEAREADYYVLSKPDWNTFSKEEAEHVVRITNGAVRVEKILKVPLLNINDVMQAYFKKPPSFVSIDVEGLDLALLKAIDFQRFRPKVFCVETLVCSTSRTLPEVSGYMESQGYVSRGGSFVNTVFLDTSIL